MCEINEKDEKEVSLLTQEQIDEALRIVDELSTRTEIVLSCNEKSFSEDRITL